MADDKENKEFPKSLLEATRYFADPDVCVDFMAAMRWPDGVTCPHCEGKRVSYLSSRRIWKCMAKECHKQFSAKTGTVFEDSAIPLDKWLMAVWLVVNCKNGISSYEIMRDLKVTQKSAWFMLHRIRLALAGGSWGKMGGEDGGPVEVDETFIGGSPKNKHFGERMKTAKTVKDQDGVMISNPDFKENRGRSSRKTPIFGIIDREARRVRACVIPGIQRNVLQDLILENVSKGSAVYSDGLREYMGLGAMGFVHDTVSHIEEYVRGEVHTNGIENFWSLLKRGLRGTYVAVEPFHLDAYVTEQVFRYNNRATKDNPLTDADRFALAVSQVSGKRLTYAELTGKVGETNAEPF
jgi:transposase-like protein